MLSPHVPARLRQAHRPMIPIYAFLNKYENWMSEASKNTCDFALGNPQNMPLPGFVQALARKVRAISKE